MSSMHRVALWALVVLAAASFVAGAAELASGVLEWSSDRPLSWSDFQGLPPAGAEKTIFVAQPYLSLGWSASYYAKGNGIEATAVVSALTVTNSLDPSLSWVVRSRVNADVLRHEQLHFDLQEVYRRLLDVTLRVLTVTRPGSAEECKQALSNLADSTSAAILARANAAQEAFETETAHGEYLQRQAYWEDRIWYLLQNPTAAP